MRSSRCSLSKGAWASRLQRLSATVVTLLAVVCLVRAESPGAQPAPSSATHLTTDEALPHGDGENAESESSISKLLSAQARSKLHSLMQEADTNGDKMLSEQEMHAWLKTLNQRSHNSWAQREFEEADTDRDGTLSLSEYKEFLNQHVDGVTTLPEEVKLRFAKSDVNKDNVLNREEFVEYATYLPLRTPAELQHSVNEIIQAYDIDGDGAITLAEFVEKAREDDFDLENAIPDANGSSETPPKPSNAQLQVDSNNEAADRRAHADEELKAEYSELDLNADGKIDFEELSKVLKQEVDEQGEHHTPHVEEASHAQLEEMKDMYPSFKSSGALSFNEILEDVQTFAESPFTAYGGILTTTQPLDKPDIIETDSSPPRPESQSPNGNRANEEL